MQIRRIGRKLAAVAAAASLTLALAGCGGSGLGGVRHRTAPRRRGLSPP